MILKIVIKILSCVAFVVVVYVLVVFALDRLSW
jgi:hypothetical protein